METTTHVLSGEVAIRGAIESAKQEHRRALIPYYPVGYPDLPASLEIILAMGEGRADIIELGMPFSDPLADGPVIQHASQVALANGVSVYTCLEAVRTLRQKGLITPLVLMGYLNPLLAYGTADFARDAASAGVQGVIIPDLPVDEADEMRETLNHHGIAMILLCAPTTRPERRAWIGRSSQGFVYQVSVRGVTGERAAIAADLAQQVAETQQYARSPVVIGFGIATPAQAQAAAHLADGVVIGSAWISMVRDGASAAEIFATVQQFRKALQTEENASPQGLTGLL